MAEKLTAVSLFSGCGGFDLGAQRAGVEIIWANDINSHAVAAYRSLLPAVPFTTGDISEVKEFPNADILIGCYPCTGFSEASRRRWRERAERDLHEREDNYLYKEFLRALKQVQPRYLFVENVRGMVSAAGGWFFNQQLHGFKDAGYKVRYAWLDASEYGVPQSRERLFIVGVRRDIKGWRYRFPKPTHGRRGEKQLVTISNAIRGMETWPDGEFLDYPFHGHYLTRNRKRGWGKPSYTIVADAHHVPLHPMGEPMVFVSKDTWSLQGEENRRLSWRECAVIQGLPTHVQPTGVLAHKYRVVGNAVPPTFGEALLLPVVSFETKYCSTLITS